MSSDLLMLMPAFSGRLIELATFVVRPGPTFGGDASFGWLEGRGFGNLVSASATRDYEARSGEIRTVNGIFGFFTPTFVGVRLSVESNTPMQDMPDRIRIRNSQGLAEFAPDTGFARRGLGSQADYAYRSGASGVSASQALVVTLDSTVTLFYG